MDIATDTPTLVATRRTLHALAEHLLAGDLARRTGRIGLRALPGGFGQPEIATPEGRRRLRIDGDRLVVLDGDRERWVTLTTAAEVAAAAGAELGAPTDAYTPETTLDPEAPLVVDPAAAADLAAWYDLVGQALEVVRRTHAAAEPSMVQLWPEHFDLACSLSEVNLGGSPGDDDHPEPYLYVGPWAPRPQGSAPLWNEAWGASIPASEVGDVADAVAFLETGLRAATGPT